MGISTISGYRGAQLFEIVGLAPEVVALCFADTPSRIGGATFADLERDARELTACAHDNVRPLDAGGLLHVMPGGEYLMYNPPVVQALHAAVRSDDADAYARYAEPTGRASCRDRVRPHVYISVLAVSLTQNLHLHPRCSPTI